MPLDLSEVTDALIGLVKSQWPSAPIWAEVGGGSATPTFTPNFTGLAPDAVRQESGPQLSLYLYHVESNNAQEAQFWQPQLLGVQTGQPTRLLPLALDLFYLLFAYSESSYSEEQEAMSVALRVFHANSIVRSDPGASTPWELTLTVEHRSYDELSRLWQATTTPLRMSLVYRASVVFIDPDPLPNAGPPATSLSVEVGPATLSPSDQDPVLITTFRQGITTPPSGPPLPFTQSPVTVAAGQTFWISGTGLGVSAVSDRLYLLSSADGSEVDVTSWVSTNESSASKLVVSLPATVGAAPSAAPTPGRYQLRVGSGAAGSPDARRSGSLPLGVAALVKGTGGPLLQGSAPFTVRGVGLVPGGATEVLLGTVPLVPAKNPPGPGQVTVRTTSFSFAPPGTGGGVEAVRVLVNGVESDPAVWVAS
jgi:hypothetical protein